MAELVLGKAGAAIGGALLPQGLSFLGAGVSGAALGRLAGSLAGAWIDASLSPPAEGPRVKEFHLTESREGAGIPVVYGRMRVGAQLIWAAEFKERRDVEGGKGGPRVAEYSYSLSFAVALCEGEVARVSRCWANGEPFDLSKVTWRLYKGTEDQAPDPLIEAIEEPGAGGAPAYRGVAYIVFEDLPVDARFAMAADGIAIEAGDLVRLDEASWRIVEVSDGGVIRFEAVRAGSQRTMELASAAPVAPEAPAGPVEPDAVVVDAPPLPGEEDDLRPIGFAFAEPWTGPVTFSGGADATEMTVRGRVARPCAMGRLASALYPHVAGRWQEASVWVTLPGAALSSRSESAVLNGANAALVETDAGWELIQYREAELVDVETYRLSGLLRGQQGSEDAMAAGAAEGARILFLTSAEQRLDVADWERSLELDWRAWRNAPDDDAAWSGKQEYSPVAARMWSPAHLSARWEGADIELSWIRRARKGGDAWAPGEPPHEVAEAYRVRVSHDGDVVREWDVALPSATYPAGGQAADFPAGGDAVVEAAQLGTDGEAGGWASLGMAIPAP